MDTSPITLCDLAAVEAPDDPAPEASGARPGRIPCLEISGEWARSLVECGCLAHESGPAAEAVRRAGPDLGTGYGKRA